MQLLFPWFLVGLLATTIPIAIHLLQLRRPQRLLFTNTAFIRDVELVTARYRNLQHFMVLCARILGIALLVLVFCQPFIPAKEPANTATSVSVLIDNSFSMQRQAGIQGSLFGEAVVMASGLGHSTVLGERLRLINAGSAQLGTEVYQSKLTDLKLTARNSFSRLQKEKADGSGQSKRLYIYSDFQKSSFNVGIVDGLKGNVVMVPLVGKTTGNVYVDSIWFEDAFIRVHVNAGLHIRLRNGGSVAVKDCAVKVLLGERQVAAFRTSVEPNQAVTSVVQVQVSSASLALGRVVTEDVPVTFDNTYYFTLQPAETIRVMEIGEQPETQQAYRNEPLFAYVFAKPSNINYGALRQANLVLLGELEQVDAGLREALRAVVKRGGSVVVVPPAGVREHASYQQLFRELGLGAVQWENQVARPELREVAMPSAREPFFRDVFGGQPRSVTMPRVAPVLRWARTGTDILRLRDGETYLANFTSGAGHVYVFSAPFSKEYSDFTAHGLFVPVMYRMAMLSYRNEQLPAYRLTQAAVGLTLPVMDGTGDVPGQNEEASFRLVRDSLALIPTQRVVGNNLRLELPVNMDAPGFYQVQRKGRTLTTLAFNQDKRESELAAYSADELRQLIGPNRPNIQVVEGGTDGVGLAKLQAEQMGQPLWRYFLTLALVCLLAEALLVRFARRQLRTKTAVAVV
jgi:hypothetical protein